MSISPPRFRRTERLAVLLAGGLVAVSCASPMGGTGTTTGADGGKAGGGASRFGGKSGSGGSHLGTGGAAGASGGSNGSGGSSATGGGSGTTGASGSSGSGGSSSGGSSGSGGSSSGGSSGSGGSSSGRSSGSGAGGAPVTIAGGGHCSAPTGANPADAMAAYYKWKNDLVVSSGAKGFLRVQRPNSSGAQVDSTVSEGIGYGMLLAVYAGDQTTFDDLWKYSQQYLDNRGLMNWYISADGNSVLGTGAATDGDEDMAFALVMADKRWGGQGTLSTTYLAAAKTQINLIWQFEVDPNHGYVLTSGDRSDGSVINISYFAPAYYRVFGQVTGATTNWNKVIDQSYTVISNTLKAQNGNATNGLVPAWSTPAGVPMTPSGTSMPLYDQLDSCRTPFRLGEDYCWNAEARALSYLQKITRFYAGVGVANLVDGYDLDGTPHPQFVTAGGPRAASFVGPAGVGAMATGSTYIQLRDEAYTSVATLMDLAGSTYYQESWTELSLQMMTGILQNLSAQ